MISFSRIGRAASVALLIGGAVLGTSARAQDVPEEQLQAARAAVSALGLTNQFDNILPGLAVRLKGQLIQAYPNFQDQITDTVDAQALSLAQRRADLEREAALVYAKAFTTDELKAIAEFYNGDAGKKLLKDGPLAGREMMKAADIWAAGVARDLNKQTNEELMKTIGPGVQATDDAAAAPKP